MIILDGSESMGGGLHDLAYDCPVLLRHIIETAIARQSGFGNDDYNMLISREREYSAITAMHWEIMCSLLPPTKASVFDKEVLRIKNELAWAGVTSDDRVEVVLWQDSFEQLVSFARRSGRAEMIKLLDVSSDELKAAGFSADYISRIIAALGQWAERLLNPDMTENDMERDEPMPDDENNDVSEDILSFFFGGETDEDE